MQTEPPTARIHDYPAPDTLIHTLRETWTAMFIATSAAILIDTAHFWGISGLHAFYGILGIFHSVATAAWVSLLAAMIWTIWTTLLTPLKHFKRSAAVSLRCILNGLLIALGAMLVMRPWLIENDPAHLLITLPLTGSLFGMLAAVLSKYLSSRFFGYFCLICSATFFAADGLLFRGLYLSWHNAAAYGMSISGTFGVMLVFGRPTLARIWKWAVAAALICQLSQFADTQPVLSAATRAGILEPKFRGLMQQMLDIDRDGFSPLFGGNDCNDLDSAMRPGACEIYGNQRDDNCNGLSDTVNPSSTMLPCPATVLPPKRFPDIYFLVVDGLRQDFGGLPDKDREPLQYLINSSMVFDNAYSVYASTYRSAISLLHSRYWRYDKRRSPNYLRVLKNNGYDVQLWAGRKRLRESSIGASIIDAERSKGDFPSVPPDDKLSWTAQLVDEAIAEVRSDSTAPPRFRWIQFFDTHSPYLRGSSNQLPIERYRVEVKHTIAHIGRLISALVSNQRGQKAIIVLMADHGEEFGEHGSTHHGANLYEVNIRVPMILRLPGVPPQRISEPAMLIDVVPTLYHYTGFAPHPHHQGRNWLHDEAGGEPRAVVSHTESVDNWGGQGLPEKFALRHMNWKLVSNIDQNDLQLFDLKNDPGEHRDIAPTHPEIVHDLSRRLAAWMDMPDCIDR